MSTVLVVDDDIINRLTLKHMLQKAGHAVILAEQGEVALNLLQSGIQPDIILMDIEMPVLNGRQAVCILKNDPVLQNTIAAPVIALTAHTLASDKKAFLNDGFDAILCKPIDEKELLSMLDVYLSANKKIPPMHGVTK